MSFWVRLLITVAVGFLPFIAIIVVLLISGYDNFLFLGFLVGVVMGVFIGIRTWRWLGSDGRPATSGMDGVHGADPNG